MADNETHEVASFAKNSRETVRVELQIFKSHRLISIRVWAERAESEPVPTRAGVALRAEQIPALRAALDAAEREAKAKGWLT